eukprot:c7430_g1_i1.p1 GENE.c7430_g1_i1~~c7430_g1_i1.p1  ORF type:complete len:480 (-),score=201.08 c7430_g1_i1:43-1446(-)
MYGGMPFGFGFGGEEEDHDHHDEDEGDGQADTQSYYDLLGVSKNASPEEIRKAYKRLAVQHHPDKGGDEAKFKELTEAANVLTDEKKREVYDKYGKKGIDAGLDKQGAGGDDLFSMLFGGGGHHQQQQQESRIAPIKIKIQVPLEALYLGKSIKMEIDRKRICKACEGSGSSIPGALTTCDECRGQGIKVQMHRVGPGLVQQVRAHCTKCGGTGDYIPDDSKCKTCLGKTISAEKKELNIVIEKGMKDGEQIVFEGEGHQIPKTQAGDVVVFVVCEKHDIFSRKGNDLKIDMKISLVEAIGSSKFFFNHLDGRVLSVERPQNSIISPGQVMVIQGEGMPRKENPFLKGDLFITFSVEFPQTLPAEVQTSLIDQLSPHCENFVSSLENAKAKKQKIQEENKTENSEGGEGGEMTEEHEIYECTMAPVNISQYGKKSAAQSEAYHDEDEVDHEGEGGEGGAPRVGCQQM